MQSRPFASIHDQKTWCNLIIIRFDASGVKKNFNAYLFIFKFILYRCWLLSGEIIQSWAVIRLGVKRGVFHQQVSQKKRLFTGMIYIYPYISTSSTYCKIFKVKLLLVLLWSTYHYEQQSLNWIVVSCITKRSVYLNQICRSC